MIIGCFNNKYILYQKILDAKLEESNSIIFNFNQILTNTNWIGLFSFPTIQLVTLSPAIPSNAFHS